MKKQTIIFLLIGVFQSAFCQVGHEKLRQNVLEKNIIGNTIVIGKWTENGGTETQVTFLGSIQTENEQYKILTSSWIWGQSKRATNRIVVYNSKNEYCGNYYVTTKCDLPSAVKNNKLIFKPNNCHECDKIQSDIGFNNGLPNEIFVECENGKGSLYTLNVRDVE